MESNLTHSNQPSYEALKSDYQLMRNRVSLLEEELTRMEELVRLMRHQRFGAKSEQNQHPGMKSLFPDFDDQQSADAIKNETEETSVAGHKRQKLPARKPLPENLPREDVYLDLSEEEKRCSCCGKADRLKIVSERISEKVHIEPAKIVVKKYHLPVYGCCDCDTMVSPLMPPHPIPRCSVTAESLAQVVISKYMDGLPLYRQEKIYARNGLDLGRDKMARWVVELGSQAKELINILRKRLIEGSFLQMDESTLQVLRENGRPPSSKSYMIVSARGDPGGDSIVIFDYSPSRAKVVMDELVGGFEGILLTDGLEVYNSFCNRNEAGKKIIHAGCWSHARRKFVEAAKGLKPAARKDSLAGQALKMVDKLFEIEDAAKNLGSESLLKTRNEKSRPVIEELNEWINKHYSSVLKKSLTGAAISYLSNQWSKLVVFLENGSVPIHNNFVENQIRPYALGRKNWLFCDRPEGAHASAALYSIVVTAKINGLNPYKYLCWLFSRFPAAKGDEAKLDALLPFKKLAVEIGQ